MYMRAQILPRYLKCRDENHSKSQNTKNHMQNLKNNNSRANLCGHQKEISGGINLPMQNFAVIDLTPSECCVYEKSPQCVGRK